jgi:hypothetical protein
MDNDFSLFLKSNTKMSSKSLHVFRRKDSLVAYAQGWFLHGSTADSVGQAVGPNFQTLCDILQAVKVHHVYLLPIYMLSVVVFMMTKHNS